MSDVIASRRESTGDRRVAIAQAARALIAEKGVEGLRTRDIAERVGINIATLHYHVPSKEALIELVATSLRHDFMRHNVDRPRAHLSVSERMELEFVDFRDTAIERPEIMLVFSELLERARRDDIIAAQIIPMKRYWRQMLQDLLAEGVASGVYRADMDPEAFATLMMSSFIGFCRSPKNTPEALEGLVAELRRAMSHPELSKSAAAPRHPGAVPVEE